MTFDKVKFTFVSSNLLGLPICVYLSQITLCDKAQNGDGVCLVTETQRHLHGFPGSALEVFGRELLIWANFARNEGIGLDHTRVSEVRHVKINKGRFATRISGITKDIQSNSKCLGYDCGHDDILQVTRLVYSINASNLVGEIANKGVQLRCRPKEPVIDRLFGRSLQF
jgi:hypothetical protein